MENVMTAPLYDTLITFFLCGGLSLLGIIGVAVLPWREEELQETADALKVAWSIAGGEGEPVEAGTGTILQFGQKRESNLRALGSARRAA